MKKKSLLLLVMLMFAVAALTGCGGSDPVVIEGEEDAIGDTLIIGMSLDNAPFGWVQAEETEDTYPLADGSGYVGGYDIQIAKIIAEEMDVKIEVVQYERGELMEALEEGKIDLMISGVNPLVTRADRVDFTDSYYDNDYVVIVMKDGKYANATAIDDFGGARLTAQNGSYIYDELLPQMAGAQVMDPLTFHADMRVALSNDVIDGYVTTLPEGMSATRLHPEYAMIAFGEEGNFETDEEYSTVAIGITKGRDALVDAVNIVLHGISDEKRTVMMDRAIYAEPEEADDEEE
ncbi:MAG: transporter substrate-binding domain-containing protein [Firmicutes bacterium]|nr:transporter substrate-binding domain-containing protein [Bacillota bacterium]